MSDEFSACLEKGKLKKQNLGASASKKEMKEAENDLKSAEASIYAKDWKWATVQAYYAMFHASRALVYEKGYREKSHYCLLIALKELFANSFSDQINSFEDAMFAREEADYCASYSKEAAEMAVVGAKQFLSAARHL